MKLKANVLMAATLAAALAVTACSAAVDPPQPGRSASDAASGQAALIFNLFSSMSADYVAAMTPDELAAQSSLAVTGTIVRLQEGRVDGDPSDQIVDAVSIVVVISPTKTVAGTVDAASDGYVYVELQSPYNRPAKDYAAALPAGTSVLVYLVPAPDAKSAGSQLQSPESGRPESQLLYMPLNPQSFVVALSDGSGVTWIGEPSEAKGATLEDALPGGTLIPQP